MTVAILIATVITKIGLVGASATPLIMPIMKTAQVVTVRTHKVSLDIVRSMLAAPHKAEVYHIQNASGHVKIGMTGINNSGQRLRQLQTGNSQKLELIKVETTPTRADAFNLERQLHDINAKNRLEGEWFKSL